jgi:hypothetical protein
MALTSYCATCDNPDPNGCDHQTHRYLDPIEYLPGPNGSSLVSDGDERERWDNPPKIVHGKANPTTIRREPREIQRLIVELEDHMFLDAPLERLLRNKHEIDPLKVTACVDHVLGKVKAGNLTSPGGFLNSRLKELP